MSHIRQDLVAVVYHSFDRWLSASSLNLACHEGCSVCCTQNVNVTAVEADLIHDYVRHHGLKAWLAAKLESAPAGRQPLQTTNEFAEQCLTGRQEMAEATATTRGRACLFLQEERCRIYPVRPFACRCMASLHTCRQGDSAELPAYYITASTAGQQLIEHIGQGQYWGNLYDVLLALCDHVDKEATARCLASASCIAQARARLKKARPLPGFLIPDDEYDQVSSFIQSVLQENIAGKRVEDILNGKGSHA
ncbi:MAG: hypothetical protein C0613_11940 [Desulfobulbaceae bacterium]|nr:MAG: hypothetical protein C0613_11940 [Desulfobulbaceae bacterium]